MHKNTLRILILITSILFFASCSEDDTISVSQSDRVTFSADTISFDTVFTAIGSSTKTFTVHNDGSHAITLQSIRLSSGGSSGFRINVDGQYGTSFADIDIYRNDSIMVFVEVTAKQQESDTPVLITDSIIFTLENGVREQVILQASGQDVTVLRNMHISSDTTLSNRRPYLIYDSLVVDKGVTLTIQEGTTLCFHSKAQMLVHGQLVCNGTEQKPIVFRGDRTDRMFSYLPYDRLDDQWGGIHLFSEGGTSVFSYCDIHSGNYGIKADISGVYFSKVIIDNSVIHNVAGDGLSLTYCSSEIANTQISNTRGHCVNIVGGRATFTACTIAQFCPWVGDRGHALNFCNILNDTIYPLDTLVFQSCVITGYANDEVYGQKLETDTVSFGYAFFNSLVNTDSAAVDMTRFSSCVFDTDTATYHEKNFRTIDTDNYIYDFRLDSISPARASGKYFRQYPADRNGNIRPSESPDAGCYQY